MTEDRDTHMHARHTARQSSLAIAKTLAALLAIAVPMTSPARAEPAEVKIAKQYGISYLPLMLMEADKLVEKYAKTDGLGDVKVTWATFAGGVVMNDAILSGDLHFASGGVGPLLTLWSRTKGALDVKCVTPMNAMPLYLNTRNPNVNSIKDLTEKDKIALPAVRVSIQALTLQMAAEKEFGVGNHGKFDNLTVGMAHPEAQSNMLTTTSEVNAHFSSPPFQYQQLKQPGIRRILNSYDVLGGPASFNFVWATGKFRKENPKTYAAFLKAYEEANAAINADKKRAAERYLEIAGDKKSSVDDILAMLNDPEIEFTMTPKATMTYANFMHKTGTIKIKPDSWKDLCFDNVHSTNGS
jgi:NitT/TauT family transport system substrate-binding protein